MKGEEEEKLEKLEALFSKFWPPKNWVSPTAAEDGEADSDYVDLHLLFIANTWVQPKEAIAAQLRLTTCLPRATEVLFQPSLIGIEQMGLMEATECVFRSTQNIFVSRGTNDL